MIFRAVFWIGLIALLAPHEPDLGLGRPGGDIALPAIVKSWAVTGRTGPGTPASDKTRSLADVKAEINASVKARGGFSYAL